MADRVLYMKRTDQTLNKRQANTIIAGIVAVILTQILCTVVLLRGSYSRTATLDELLRAESLHSVERRL